ncbi:hypothetical protein PILCRDRAFT_91923 [Piloderma croceum F 1598]|uniref:PH domain-containing protein n=1 Tax=Piloderma croceum (strain F 1598) TaxID=765440 RepID=A0A0C3F7B9_PILCF|nr:hypothetical protein PILCRDRAFT_91923 [Piloderma croceum F 1598]
MGVGLGISVGGEEKKRARADMNGTVNPRLRTPESDSSYTELEQEEEEEGEESPSSGENDSAPAPEAEVELPRQTSLSRKQGSLSSGRTPRISREDVKRRLMRKRSDSPEYPLTEEQEEAGGGGEDEGKSMTDFDLSNAEVGTIETVVEKRNIAMSIMTPPKPSPLPLPHPNIDGDGLKFDMGQFGMGEGMSFGEVDVDMRSALDRLMDDVAAGSAGKPSSSSAARRKGSMRVEDLTRGVKAGRFEVGDDFSKYLVKEQATIYASSDERRIEHMESAGDVDAGKAWRPVRRPSDMNEYSKQIKEYRAQEKPGKAHGKVFVRVIGLSGVNVPLPQQATAVTCTLNNGIHFVTTPECQFDRDSRIDQEFELIEHSKLEFTLTLKIRRDPHIISMFKTIVPTPAQPPAAPISKGGMRAFFSSPKKSKNAAKIAAPSIPDNLARYLKPDGTLARAFISFKDIAARCDTKLFETSYPLIGQRIEVGGAMSTLQVGELVLQVFRLPALPGVPSDQLPQSLEECSRGLRHVNWHKVTYFEGTLTQQGGDCTTWRRRQLRVIGANLVAFNDVTKKATATIGLKKAIAVEDDQADPLSSAAARSRDDYDGLGGVERSFRLIFPNDEEIVFFADTDEEKAKWSVIPVEIMRSLLTNNDRLEVLRALVGHIPPNPLWAELIWQRQDELKKQAAVASLSTGSSEDD